MAFDISTIQNLVGVVTVLLDKAKDAAPAVTEAVNELATSARNLIDEIKTDIGSIVLSATTMTPNQTHAALDAARAELDTYLADVKTAPTPKPATDEQ